MKLQEALLAYAVQHFTIGFMPHPWPGASVRVTVIVSCPAAISTCATLQLFCAPHLVTLSASMEKESPYVSEPSQFAVLSLAGQMNFLST